MTQIRDVKRVHMIGVGGSSMSGLAGLLKDEGYEVSGSDRTRSHKTEALEAHGVKVLIPPPSRRTTPSAPRPRGWAYRRWSAATSSGS